MIKLTLALALLLTALGSIGCGKHDCDLGSDEAKFGAVAEMTKGAHSCMVINAELIATHGDTTVDDVTTKYKAVADAKGWKVEVKDYKGERANGKPLEGKLLGAEVDGKKAVTLIYSLSGDLIETVTSVE